MPKTEKKRKKKNVSRKGGMLVSQASRFRIPVKRNLLGTHNNLSTGFNVLYPLSLLYNKQKVPEDFSLPSDVNADISSELNKYPDLKNIVDEEKLKEFFRKMFYNISHGKQNGGSRSIALSENRVALKEEPSFPWKAYIAFFIGIIALCFSFYQAYLLNPRRHLNEFLEDDPNANVYIKVFEGLEEYEPVDFYGIPYPNVMSIVKSASIFALSVALEIAKNDYKSTLTRIVGGEQTSIPKKVFQYIKIGYFFIKRNLAGKVVEYSNRKIARSVGEIQDTIGIYAGKVDDDIRIGLMLASVGVTLITASTPFVYRHLKLLYNNRKQALPIADVIPGAVAVAAISDQLPQGNVLIKKRDLSRFKPRK
jgi:hypothetical protein